MDYASVESLTAALQGIDAVVSTVGGAALHAQDVLIEAAAIAGVKRFIPSEYGSVTTNPKLATFPLYEGMFKIKKILEEKAAAGQMSWTVLACGAFLDFMVGGPISPLDFKHRKATLFDEGDNRMSATTLPACGEAVASILKNVEATKNRVVHVSQVILTQNRVLRIAERLRPDEKWEIEKVGSSATLQDGLDGVKAGDFSFPVIAKVLLGTVMAGDVYGSAFDETDNELLGIQEMTEEELTKVVAEKLA